MNGEKPTRPQPYRKNYRCLRKAGSDRGRGIHSTALQLVTQCQMVRPGNIQMRNIAQTERILFRDPHAYVNANMNPITNNGKRDHVF